MKSYASVDRAGLTLSALCIIHCVFLPLLATTLPLIGVLAEIEWVHKALVLLAVPVALSLIGSKIGLITRGLAIIGISLLLGAAFLEVLHDLETGLTVLGACMLALAHLLRLSNAGHSH